MFIFCRKECEVTAMMKDTNKRDDREQFRIRAHTVVALQMNRGKMLVTFGMTSGVFVFLVVGMVKDDLSTV